MNSAPIVIGGTGGSGTRIVCQITQIAGVFMGDKHAMNYAEDSLLFASLIGMYMDGAVDLDNVLSRAVNVHCEHVEPECKWGWKETRSYLIPWFFHKKWPDMKFVHVVRDGRDMAYAPVTGMHVYWTDDMNVGNDVDPLHLMALWATTNMQAATYGEHSMENYHRIRYEDLCKKPRHTIENLYDFLGVYGNTDYAVSIVQPSKGIGRWRNESNSPDVARIGAKALRRFEYIS